VKTIACGYHLPGERFREVSSLARRNMTDLLAIRDLERTSPEFREALVKMAAGLGMNPSYIAAVMAIESKFDPRATNPFTRATGLIQFMPATAASLGTSVDALRSMSAIGQLTYVEKFFHPWIGRLHTPGDYYFAVFLPKYVGRSRATEIARAGMAIYDQNRGLDANQDGILTVGDASGIIESIVARAERLPRIQVGEFSLVSTLAWAAAGVVLVGSVLYVNQELRLFPKLPRVPVPSFAY